MIWQIPKKGRVSAHKSSICRSLRN